MAMMATAADDDVSAVGATPLGGAERERQVRRGRRVWPQGAGRGAGVLVGLILVLVLAVGVGTAQASATPTVSAVWPRTGPVAGGTPLSVVGSGFYGGGTTPSVTSVTVDGIAATNFTVVSDSVLTVQVPALPSGTTTPSSGPVVVTTSGTSGGTSASSSGLATYTYRTGLALGVPSYFNDTDTGVTGFGGIEGPPRTADLAVLNPDSGPNTAADPAFAADVAGMQANGVDVIGYVDTAYATIPLSTVEAQITDYENWYGVNGIFLDDVTTDCTDAANYYAPLYAFIHAQPGLDLAVLNPGTTSNACYMPVSNVLMTFEDTPSGLASGASTIPGYDPSRFWGIVYGTSSSSSVLSSDLATLSNDGFGMAYVTNLGTGSSNPYDALPSYWAQEVSDAASVASPPAPGRAAPSITTQPTNQTVTAGQTATFSAGASGTPTPTVQWQVSTNSGSTWTPITGATSPVLTLSAVATSMSGDQYEAVFTNGVGNPATTQPATLTVTTAPVAPAITSASSLTTPHGVAFSFRVTATGTPTPTLSESGRLPSGVTFTGGSAGSATLSGTSSTHKGTYTFTITATSGRARATQRFTLTLT
jgi:hypothetical protein